MLKDVPYSIIQQDERPYEIMLLRDQHGNTLTDIAKEYELSVTRTVQVYNKIKITQIRLYINHIAFVLGHEDISQVRKVFDAAYDCYQEWTYACAYLERQYRKILDDYRAGEPGMPLQFIKNMPPFRAKLSKKVITRLIEMREAEKASYISIANKLRVTREKAKHTYEWFYHKQVLEILKAKEKQIWGFDEKRALWDYYFKGYRTSKKRYDALTSGITSET